MSTSTTPETAERPLRDHAERPLRDHAERPLRADARRNRERLVEAGRAAFLARGRDASLEEVARAADVGVGTLYRHFPRRIDLVEAVYREDVDALIARGEELLDEDDTWAALEGWLGAFVRYAAAKRTFLTELHEAFEKSPELAVSSRERIVGVTGRVLARAQGAGTARPDLTTEELQQLVSGMCMSRSATPVPNERLLTYVLDGIRARP